MLENRTFPSSRFFIQKSFDQPRIGKQQIFHRKPHKRYGVLLIELLKRVPTCYIALMYRSARVSSLQLGKCHHSLTTNHTRYHHPKSLLYLDLVAPAWHMLCSEQQNDLYSDYHLAKVS